MKRSYLIQYLDGEGCYAEEGTASIAGEWWINLNNPILQTHFPNELQGRADYIRMDKGGTERHLNYLMNYQG